MPILHSLFYMITNKATVKLPLFDTTSVCGNYNIEVRGQLCDGTETIETLNWDRYHLSPAYGQPSLDYIFSTSMSCTIGQNCWLEIETSRATELDIDLDDTSNNNQLQLMTIGRLHWKKDYTSVILALKNLKDRGIDFEYTIIGDGPEEEKLKYLVYELGLINNIIFTGKISQKEILIYFKKSHFYLQYSLQEGFCNAVLEAQSMGVLPIVSNAEGLSENVLNNITGWVIQKNSPKLLAEKIVEVINLPESNKEKIRKQAIERVTKEFNIEKQQKEFIDFYTK